MSNFSIHSNKKPQIIINKVEAKQTVKGDRGPRGRKGERGQPGERGPRGQSCVRSASPMSAGTGLLSSQTPR